MQILLFVLCIIWKCSKTNLYVFIYKQIQENEMLQEINVKVKLFL
jgi:hypothetical protein